MDRDTRLHFLRILRDGADLQGLEAYTTDPVRFVHRDEVDWSDPDWVGDAPNQTGVGTPPPATAKDTAPRTNAPTKTYYDVLQVRPDAEPKAIKAAYRWFAIKYQPDVAFDPDVARQMAELKTAYSVLGDPIRRKRYDAELLWEAETMDTGKREGNPGTSGEAAGNPPPVHRSFARRLGLFLAFVLVVIVVGVGGLWLRTELQEKRLENIVSQTHDWPLQEMALEPGAKFKVGLRTRCSNGYLDYLLIVEPEVEPPRSIDPAASGGGEDVRKYIAAREHAVQTAMRHLPFGLTFFDKDGFERLSFSASPIQQTLDSEGHIYRLEVNGKAACHGETYAQFASWSPGWR